MLSQSQRDLLEHAVNTYQATLAHDSEAVAYLQGRGISKETAAMYRLGCVREPVRGDDEYVNRIAIPYITTGGVVDIRYRSLDPSVKPKYMSRAGSALRMFSVRSLTYDSKFLAVCEGEFDAITLNQAGVPAVGIPGANAWKDHWADLLDDYNHVIVVCDGDVAGSEFGKRMADRLSQAVIVNMPDGEDVNSFFNSHGADALKERIGV